MSYEEVNDIISRIMQMQYTTKQISEEVKICKQKCLASIKMAEEINGWLPNVAK